jgi:uncharacterized protein (DUF736 family)
MSQQYTNESTFVLFKNDKGDNPKRPDYRGKLYVGGEEYRLSGWISEKKDGSGEKYLRGKIDRAEVSTNAMAKPAAPTQAPQTDDIPF